MFALLELNAPVLKSKPFRFNVPAVNVYVHVTANVNVAFNVTVPALCTNEGVVIVPPLYVNDPEVSVKLEEALIVP
jgi:hypothetical protein